MVKERLIKFMKEPHSAKKVYKTIGILASIGIGSFLAFRFIPWNKITDRFELSFDEVFGESEFNTAAEGSI